MSRKKIKYPDNTIEDNITTRQQRRDQKEASEDMDCGGDQDLGDDVSDKKNEINLLILGETGVGKSTWINAFANYLSFDHLEEAKDSDTDIAVIPSKFSFTSDDGESQDVFIGNEADNENFAAGQSATQEPRTHSFDLGRQVINLIDTPGIGDSRGVDQDKKNFDSILGHLSHVKDVHAICILLKPNNARLTVVFRFCIQQLLAHLHKDAARNIIFCFTHARGNFYKPGDTLPALRQELLNRNVDIEVNRSNMYCFDSEAFRFLVCVKNGIEFPPEDTEVFAASWTRAVKEKNRMFEYIMTLRPHKIYDTLSMNDARRVIVAMSRPLAEMSVTIQKNIKQAAEAKEKARLADLEAVDFEKYLHVDGVDLEYVQLGYPRTVCTDRSCIEHIATGKDNIQQVNYKTHCHPHCGLDGVPTETVGDSRLQNCLAMQPSKTTCNVCGHSFNVHMHRTYDLMLVRRRFISDAVQKKIKAKKDAQGKMDVLTAGYSKLVVEFELEQKEVLRISATYGSFLKEVAILPYNDALGDYLDMTIEQEDQKDNSLRDPELIARLRSSRRAYEEEKQLLDNAMALSDDGQNTRFTPAEIKNLQKELFHMKHFGDSLKTIFDNIDGVKKKRYIYKQIRVPASLRTRIAQSLMAGFKRLTRSTSQRGDFEEIEKM